MSRDSESWFDRLAAPHTRRQGLKAAAAGTVASVTAGVFFARPPAEAKAAESPSDCRQGCIFTAKQNFTSERRSHQASYAAVILGSTLGFGPIVGPIYNMVIDNLSSQTSDEIWWDYKKAYGSCFKPFCPGFNPRQEGGPCDGCNPPLSCNPCPAIESGYICCIYEAGDPNGDCCPA